MLLKYQPTTHKSPAEVPKKRPYKGENLRRVKSMKKRAELSRLAKESVMSYNVRLKSATTKAMAEV